MLEKALVMSIEFGGGFAAIALIEKEAPKTIREIVLFIFVVSMITMVTGLQMRYQDH